jgi:hypothetical protein
VKTAYGSPPKNIREYPGKNHETIENNEK